MSRHGSNEKAAVEAVGRPSRCRFKGVVPQPNGHWGAQIYAHHERIWLGTFKTEQDAARGYDSAAMKLRRTDPHRNLPADEAALNLEADFQRQYTEEVILRMIKDGSYLGKLAEFGLARQADPASPGLVDRAGGAEACEYGGHFEKALTPSDVGKLNRLVIPKKFAVKFFPNLERAAVVDPELEFEDVSTGARWRFRYCYWKSSQSFVFTKGWSRFVKAKGLKNKDVVIFYSYQMRPKPGTFAMVDVRYFKAEGARGGGQPEEDEEEAAGQVQVENAAEVEEARPGIRLFGVHIE